MLELGDAGLVRSVELRLDQSDCQLPFYVEPRRLPLGDFFRPTPSFPSRAIGNRPSGKDALFAPTREPGCARVRTPAPLGVPGLIRGALVKIEILSYETTPTFYGWNRQCYDI